MEGIIKPNVFPFQTWRFNLNLFDFNPCILDVAMRKRKYLFFYYLFISCPLPVSAPANGSDCDRSEDKFNPSRTCHFGIVCEHKVSAVGSSSSFPWLSGKETIRMYAIETSCKSHPSPFPQPSQHKLKIIKLSPILLIIRCFGSVSTHFT